MGVDAYMCAVFPHPMTEADLTDLGRRMFIEAPVTREVFGWHRLDDTGITNEEKLFSQEWYAIEMHQYEKAMLLLDGSEVFRFYARPGSKVTHAGIRLGSRYYCPEYPRGHRDAIVGIAEALERLVPGVIVGYAGDGNISHDDDGGVCWGHLDAVYRAHLMGTLDPNYEGSVRYFSSQLSDVTMASSIHGFVPYAVWTDDGSPLGLPDRAAEEFLLLADDRRQNDLERG